MNVNEIRALEDMDPIPKPKDADDYDGTDYTPLQIQVAAARGIKEILGEGVDTGDGGVESNPQNTGKPGQPAPAAPAAPQAPPQPVPAVNGSNGKPRAPARP